MSLVFTSLLELPLVKMIVPLIGYRSWYCDRKRLVVMEDFYFYIHFLQFLQSRSSAWLTVC
jgi:hypothetical protein